MSAVFALVLAAAALLECWALICVPSWVRAVQRGRLRGWRAHAAVVFIGVLGLSAVQSLGSAVFGSPSASQKGQPAKVSGLASSSK